MQFNLEWRLALKKGACIGAILVATLHPAFSQQQQTAPADDPLNVSLSSGLDYSSGKYDAKQTTDIVAALTSLSLKRDNVQFSISLPYLDIQGPTSVVAGANGIPVAIKKKAAVASSGSRSGWGDLNLSATYTLPEDAIEGFQVDFTGRGKIAIANTAKGLSSGENDFGFSIDVSRQIDIWSPFVTLGYRVPGSTATYSLNSAPSFSVGTSVQLDDQVLVIASYDFDGSISKTLADSQQFFSSASWLINDAFTLTVYASKGLSAGAPQIGTGLLVGWKIL